MPDLGPNCLQWLSGDDKSCHQLAKSYLPLISLVCLYNTFFHPHSSILSPCDTKPLFHCTSADLYNFPERPEMARQILIFFMKNGLSQRPYSDQGVAMELLWCSYAFLWHSCWSFSVLSRHFHDAHNACISLSPHSHCADSVLKMH